MRNTLLAAAAAFVIGGVSVGAFVSYAQPAPPPPSPDGGPPGMHRPGWMGPGGMRWRRMREGMREGRGPVKPGTFALIYRQADRNLTPPDVQKIAEAFLLWNGNHTWKVVNVAATQDGAIGFSLATQDGSVIAQFTMDPHTGRVTRSG